MADCSINTVTKLLIDIGTALRRLSGPRRCATSHASACSAMKSGPFVYSKQKNVSADKCGQFGVGDVWTWTTIDADTKLVPSFMIGGRDAGVAYDFMQDLAGRLASRVQLTTDGHRAYLEAVEAAFGADVDYAAAREDLRSC
jgi:hypothetical protein